MHTPVSQPSLNPTQGVHIPFDKSRPWAASSNFPKPSSSRIQMVNTQQFMTNQLEQPMFGQDASPHPDLLTRNEVKSRPSHARRPKNGARKGRGTLKGYSVAKKLKDNEDRKLTISFSKRLGGAAGINRRAFIDEIGVQVRLHAPILGIDKWCKVLMAAKLTIKSLYWINMK